MKSTRCHVDCMHLLSVYKRSAIPQGFFVFSVCFFCLFFCFFSNTVCLRIFHLFSTTKDKLNVNLVNTRVTSMKLAELLATTQ